MKDIKIKVHGGSAESSSPEYLFQNIPELYKQYNFITCDDPDYWFEYGKNGPPRGRFVKIGWFEEYAVPNLDHWDWVMGWQYENMIPASKYIRFTNYFMLGGGENLIKPKGYDPQAILASKTKFCNHVYYHYVPERDELALQLAKYKQVDAPGVCLNNCTPIGEHKTIIKSRGAPNRWQEKIEWSKPYKFTIAVENRWAMGYTSEKIYMQC